MKHGEIPEKKKTKKKTRKTLTYHWYRLHCEHKMFKVCDKVYGNDKYPQILLLEYLRERLRAVFLSQIKTKCDDNLSVLKLAVKRCPNYFLSIVIFYK